MTEKNLVFFNVNTEIADVCVIAFKYSTKFSKSWKKKGERKADCQAGVDYTRYENTIEKGRGSIPSLSSSYVCQPKLPFLLPFLPSPQWVG